MRRFFLCVAMLVGLPAQAQTPATAPPFEVVKDNVDLEVAASGAYWESHEWTARILTSQGVEALRQFHYSYTPGYENLTVSHAFTTKKDGTRIDLPADGILYGTGQSSGTGYQADRTITGVLPNVEIGDEITIDTVYQQTVPWFPGVFAANFEMPRGVAERDFNLALTAPAAGLNLAIDAKGLEAGAVETGSGKVRRSWHYQNSAPTRAEADDTAELDDLPHVSVSTLSDYADAARLHGRLYAGRAAANPAIQALADRLTMGITDRRAQAKALYDWVATHIKYVAIVLGAGGFTPHEAGDVLRNGYGDCKDHVMLLQALLAAKSIPSSPVLIRAGANQFDLPKSVSPFLFDHLITYIPEFQLYLDSTAQYATFGVLPYGDSGKAVLQVESGKVDRTPASRDSMLRADIVLTVNKDGSADGETKVQATGASAVDLRAELAALPVDAENDFFARALGAGSSGSFQKGDEDLSDRYDVSIHYHIANFAAFPGPGSFPNQIGFKPFSFSNLIGATLPATRGVSYVCPSLNAEEHVTMTLPAGLKLAALPPNRHIATAEIDLTRNYSLPKPGTLRQNVVLHLAHPQAVCSAGYYAKVHDDLVKMVGMLRSQIVYR